jgi:type II secretory pathway pseudopilin PulG
MSATGDGAGGLRGDAGTTLIEALVVVAVTAMATLIVFPALRQGFGALAGRQTVAVVAARLRQARAQALRGDQPVTFFVDENERDYGVMGGAVERVPPGVTLVAADAAARRIGFYGDGSSSGGLIGVRAGGRATLVAVAPVSGAVAVRP